MNAKFLTLPILLLLTSFTQLTYGQIAIGTGGDLMRSRIYFANNQLYYLGIDSISTNVYTVMPSDKYNWSYSTSIYFQKQLSSHLILEVAIAQSMIKDKVKINEYFDPSSPTPYIFEEYSSLLNNYGELTEIPFLGVFPSITDVVNETNEIDIRLRTFNIPLSLMYTPNITPRSKMLFKIGLSANLIVNHDIDTKLEFHLYDINAEKAFKLVQTAHVLGMGYRFSFSNSKYFDLIFQTSTSLYSISNIQAFKPYEDQSSIDVPPIKRRGFGIQLKYFWGKL